jgi:hypothetical protein
MAGGSTAPSIWTITSQGGATIEVSSNQHVEGGSSLHATAGGGVSPVVYQDVAATANGIYTFSGSINVVTSASVQAYVRLIAYDANNVARTTVNLPSTMSVTGGFVSMNGGSITACSTCNRVRVQLMLSNLKADLYVDNFSFTKTG